jgi:hypothetical protein
MEAGRTSESHQLVTQRDALSQVHAHGTLCVLTQSLQPDCLRLRCSVLRWLASPLEGLHRRHRSGAGKGSRSNGQRCPNRYQSRVIESNPERLEVLHVPLIARRTAAIGLDKVGLRWDCSADDCGDGRKAILAGLALLREGDANSFGVDSAGVWQVRGNGSIALTRHELLFAQWARGALPLRAASAKEQPDDRLIPRAARRRGSPRPAPVRGGSRA